MEKKLCIGVDISKQIIDVAIQLPGGSILHHQFSNTEKGFKAMIAWLSGQSQLCEDQWIFCMEHTGVYALPLACYLSEKKLKFCLENPYHIKHSMGLQRGKSDKADAKMIARYTRMHQEELRLSHFPGKLLIKLQALLAYRARLIKTKTGLQTASKELSAFSEKEIHAHIAKETKSLVKCISNRIKKADQQLDSLLQADASIHKNYQLATSITGIGPMIAAYMILYTQNFTTITDSRKFASFSGIAPFAESSGSSLNKSPRVSHLANKKIKMRLNNGAWNAAKYDKEIKIYFERKVAEGKNKRSVINAIKNKLVSRVFAVIKRGTPYVSVVNYT